MRILIVAQQNKTLNRRFVFSLSRFWELWVSSIEIILVEIFFFKMKLSREVLLLILWFSTLSSSYKIGIGYNRNVFSSISEPSYAHLPLNNTASYNNLIFVRNGEEQRDDEVTKHYNPKSKQQQFTESLEIWWKKLTEGRRGLLLILTPAIINQFRILQTTVPFCADRLLQYVQPLNLLLLTMLSQAKGVRILQSVLFAGIGIGLLQMAKDSLTTGFSWMPMYALDDSYALITG
jgi:hypothetical protein